MLEANVTRRDAVSLPQPISEAEIIYAEVSGSKLRELAKMIGGVIKPASIANACCKPQVIATNSGISDLRP